MKEQDASFILIIILTASFGVFFPQTISAQTFLLEFGEFGLTGDGKFSLPDDVAVDSSSNIYVVDNHRVQKFNSAGTFQGWMGMCTGGTNCDVPNQKSNGFSCTAATCSGEGSTGSGDGQFNFAFGIAVDSSDNIYVTDINNVRVQKFNSAGAFQGWMGMCTGGTNCDVPNEKSNGFSCTAATCSGVGSSGSGDGQFNFLIAIAFDTSGNIYVLESGNNRVQKFNSAGVFQDKFGSFGTADGQFDSPAGITVDTSGNIYVVDVGNNRVQKFNSAFVFQDKFGSLCDLDFNSDFIYDDPSPECNTSSPGAIAVGDGQLNLTDVFVGITPIGIGLDSSGNIYVVDSGNQRIQKFNSAGVFQLKFGSFGSGMGQFDFPHGMVVDSSRDIYVVDTGNRIIQIFGFPPCTTPISGNWIITSSCKLTSIFLAPADVTVQNNSILLIPNGITLDINFVVSKLDVKSGSGVLIVAGGKIT